MKTVRTVAPGVYLLENGKYLVRLQHKGRRVNRVLATEEAARMFRRSLAEETATGENDPVAGNSMATLGGAFLASRKGRDQLNPRNRWKNHVARAPFFARPIASIEPADILDWLDEHPASWQTRKHLLILVRGFFHWALGRRLVTANPCVELHVARSDSDTEDGWKPGWYLDPAEQEQLLAAIEDPEARRMATVALFTGLRLGEVLCMHLVDVHEHHLHVRVGGWDAKRQRYKPPKGKAGSDKVRDVSLFGAAREAVLEQLAELERRREELPANASRARRTLAENPLGLLFPGRWGGRRTHPHKAFTEAAKRVTIERLGGDGHPWWHLLRHTCATSLCAGWWGERWPLRDVQKHMGHSSMATTERYAKLTDDVVKETAIRAHAAWVRGNAVATPSARRGDGKPRIVGRARLDSNQRPSASEADRYVPLPGEDAASCHAVATSVEALQAIESGKPWALSRCVDALRLCILALSQRASARTAKAEGWQ